MPVKHSYESVAEEFNRRGYFLIETNYENNKQKLRYECTRHSGIIQKIRFNDLSTGHGCRYCGEESTFRNLRKMSFKQRTPKDVVQKEFERRGYTLLSEYKNAREHLNYKCSKHPDKLLKIRYCDLKSGNGCRFCAIEGQRLSYGEVKERFKQRGYILLETEYLNSRTLMRYRCPNHPDVKTTITLNDLTGGHGCQHCAIENSKGKLSVHYNHDLPDEDREKDRRYDAEIYAWRKAVFERDKFTCLRCGDNRGGNLNAHHKDGFAWCVDRRYDTTNGATLCVDCHRRFHSIYGNSHNTESQFMEYLEKEDLTND